MSLSSKAAFLSGLALGPLASTLLALLVLAMTLGILCLSVPTARAETFTWTGEAPTGEANWSDASNWTKELASSPSTDLVFPALTRNACEVKTETCGSSHNDLFGFEAGTMTLDCYLPYSITGNVVSLNTGLKYSCPSGGRRFFELPLSLAASQSWLVEGSESNLAELWYGASVAGGANSLELNLVDSGAFVLYGADIQAKHITVNGFGKGVLGLVPKQFAFGGGEEARLNAGGGPVTLNHANLSGDGTVGELESYDTTTEPDHQISVAGNAYFDSASTIVLSVEPLVPSRLAVSGILSLASPHLSLSTTFAEECPVLGQEFILITASGGLGGSFNGITNGGTTQAECGGVKSTFQIRYTANEVIATVMGEPPPPPPSPPANTSPAVVAEIGSLRGNAPTYECRSGWSGSGTITTTATWMRDGSPVISQAPSAPYIATSADAGQQLSCTVSASSAYGSASSTSGSIEVPGYWQPAVRLLPMPINEVREPCYRFLGSSTCDAPTIYFAGEIIPGSKPVTQYEFRYAPLTYTSPLCDSYGQNCLPSQKEVGGSNPPTGPIQACVGQCPPPYGTVSRLPAFQRWVYYLEAKDGITDTKSTPETYLSGGLINPRQWEPAKELSLTLECPSSCPGIETQSAFGLHAPFRGTEAATIKVTNFNRANGYFEGTVDFSAYAGGSPKVHGQLAEGLASLEFETSLGPITSAFRNFTLGGAITYAGVNFDTTNGYSSKFEGVTGNGGKWVVCSGSAAGSGCPGRPNAETKAVAGNLSSGAGIIGLGFAAIPGLDLFDIGAGVVGVVTDLIAHDPPDPAYTRIAVPPKLRPVVIRPGPRLSRRAAAAGTRVLHGLREVAGYGEALLNAVQRMQGAIRERQRAWVARQTRAAIKYSLDVAKRCRSLAQVLNSTRTALSHSAIGRLRLSAKQVARGIQQVRRHGLPSRVVAELRTMGFTPEMIRSARQLVGDSPHHAVAPLAGLLAPAFSEHLAQLANQLEEYAKTLATSPHS